MQHDRRIFPDGVHHHRVGEFSSHFTDDMDTLRLQLPQMSQSFFVHNRSFKPNPQPTGVEYRQSQDDAQTTPVADEVLPPHQSPATPASAPVEPDVQDYQACRSAPADPHAFPGQSDRK